MDLKELTSGTPATKPWLTIVAKSVAVQTASVDELKVDTVEVHEIHSDLLSLTDTGSVPNPPIGTVSFYSTGTDLKSMDPLGNESTFLTSTNCHDFVSIEEASAIENRVSPLAPFGLRDTWQSPAVAAFDGGGLTYFDDPDILYTGAFWASDPYYSVDGGVTFAPVVFDVPYASSWAPSIGYNGTIYVALTGDATDPGYTSVDGVNFTAAATPSGAVIDSMKILWVERLGLFIAPVVVDATHWIVTSPNGQVWTPRVTPNFTGNINGIDIADNGDIIVITGEGGPNAAWSTDGIVWVAATGVTDNPQAVVWSPDRKEFVCVAGSGDVFQSDDGKVWIPKGIIAPGASISIIWVGGDVRLYYVNQRSPQGSYGLWISPNADTVFASTELKGATNNSPTYSTTVYMESRKRLALGIDTLGIGYSTNTPGVVKSMADSINVHGSPVSVDQYSNTQSVLVVNTAVETTISPVVNSLGSMVLQRQQPIGMVIDFCCFLEVSSVAGDSLTITIKTQAGSLYSDVLTIPALANKLPICIRGCMTVRAAIAVVNAVTTQNTASKVSLQSGAFDPTAQNTLNFTATWGANASSLEAQQIVLNTHFRNGA